MSEGLYSHTTRGTGTVLTAAIYNSDHQNHITNQNPSMTGGYSDNVAEMQLVTDPGGLGSENLSANLAGELRRLRFAIARITGEAQWYIEPAIDLAETEAAVIAGTFEKLFVTNELTPAQITANQNNYAPTGHADAFHFRLSSDALRDITGLAGGDIGRIVCLTNIGSFGIQLIDESDSSTEANRFVIGDQDLLVLNPEESALLRYDSTSDRWRPLQSTVPLLDAEDIAYDNATSGLTAADTQAAIDEVSANVEGSRAELIAIIEDQKAQNTAGGTFTSGADRTRVLNTLVYNRDTLVSLGSNQFTLPAGIWEIEWSASAAGVDNHQSFLYNVTDAAEVARGTSESTPEANICTRSVGSPRVSIAGAKAFEIRHRCLTTNADDGFGQPANFGTEVYTRVIVRRSNEL